MSEAEQSGHVVLRAMIVVGLLMMAISRIAVTVSNHNHRDLSSSTSFYANGRTNLPPTYRVLTDGETWVWERQLSPEFPSNWFREIQDHSTKQEAIDSAWYQYNFDLHASTNKWEVR